ncbi:hypothetical protein D7B24_009306 [Verticillium nonalfalfae]|uniref:F-box domain-containing protein n=1 Tax=Verticillium nonalfalfae TaxID=1051616 RepID=A0A3M9Y567_9PEZI|nr:uncharacterized protein D7B24_009306 [Verticillium nonalfalfae]RNJ54926.1 hypothetical protein D7B24_009306 [Verticillium nonalfalfae]
MTKEASNAFALVEMLVPELPATISVPATEENASHPGHSAAEHGSTVLTNGDLSQDLEDLTLDGEGSDSAHELHMVPGPPPPVTSSERVAADGNLTIRSKRTERQRKRLEKKASKRPPKSIGTGLFPLPDELLLSIFANLRPSDLLRLQQTCTSMREYLRTWESVLVKEVIARRYACLEPCLRLPALMKDIDPSIHPALLHPERQGGMGIHKKFQHVLPADPTCICTCLTCILRWNSLCLVVDFAHWQPNLDSGTPIPMIPRGKFPVWNEDLVAENAKIVQRALISPLWYARVLEVHLNSTTRSIRRHAANQGNRRRRFRMAKEDEMSGTDEFLQRSGPPTMDFPFHRDNYYMLESYLPNRGWSSDLERWLYMPDWHERDLHWVSERWGETSSSGKSSSMQQATDQGGTGTEATENQSCNSATIPAPTQPTENTGNAHRPLELPK